MDILNEAFKKLERVVNLMVQVRSDNIVHVPTKVIHMYLPQSWKLKCDRSLYINGILQNRYNLYMFISYQVIIQNSI